jgi:hypothetical protein
MAKGVMLVFTNPVSADREDDYNKWYNGVHKDEFCATEGVLGMTRYKLSEQQVPGVERPPYQYLTIYELKDIPTVLPKVLGLKTTRTDALDPKSSLVLFEPIMEYRK